MCPCPDNAATLPVCGVPAVSQLRPDEGVESESVPKKKKVGDYTVEDPRAGSSAIAPGVASASPPIAGAATPSDPIGDVIAAEDLLLLLNGIDDNRTKHDNKERFRRHHLQIVKFINCKKLANLTVFEQYEKRALDQYQIKVSVRDFKQFAGNNRRDELVGGAGCEDIAAA